MTIAQYEQTVANMLEETPFRFLDLPKELRFMVYENLDITTKKFQFLPQDDGFRVRRSKTSSPLDSHPSINVSIQTLPVQIFTTCRLIYAESLPFLIRKMDRMSEIEPRVSIDADCLYTSALDNVLQLFCALLATLDAHPFFTSKSTTIISPPSPPPPKAAIQASSYPSEIHHWLTQTTHLLLSQRPQPNPFAGFMGALVHPTVRLILEVPKVWRYTPYHGLSTEAPTTPPLYTGGVTSQLSQLYGGLVEFTKGLGHVTSGAIVFEQEDERVLLKEGLVVRKRVALDFGICRVVEGSLW